MKTMCYLAFGDLRGWDTRFVLRLRAERPKQVPVHIDHGFAHALVGGNVVYGPVVLDETDDAGDRTLVIYLGQAIPDWVGGSLPNEHGWEVSDILPDRTDVNMRNVDLLLLEYGLHTRGWTRTVWLPYIPRPMQRIDLPLGDGEGPTVEVRVLEVGDDLIVENDNPPFVVVSCRVPYPTPELLEAYQWAEEEWVAAKQGAWAGLDAMSDTVESHVGVVLGHAVVTHVTLRSPADLVDEALPLLPRDVRTAIDFACDGSEDGLDG